MSASVSQETDLARAKILGASDAGIIPTQVLKERRHARSHLEVEHLTKLNARLKEDLEEERAKGMSLRKEIGLLKEEIVRLNAGKRDHLRARAVAVHELGEEKRARVGLGDAKRALEGKSMRSLPKRARRGSASTTAWQLASGRGRRRRRRGGLKSGHWVA